MPKCATLDEGLRQLRHLNRRHHARRHADRLERVHHRERVDNRREHAHRIARHAINALAGARESAEDVAAAENNADLAPERVDFLDVIGHKRQVLRVDALARFLVAENLA